MHRSKSLMTVFAIFLLLCPAITTYGQDKGGASLSQISDITDSTGTVEGDCPNYPPVFDPFQTEEDFYICEGSTIYDTIIVTDPNDWQTITLEIFSGPGTLSAEPATPPVTGYYEYTPPEEGSFDVTFVADDGHGETVYATKTYNVYFNQLPIITNGGAVVDVWAVGEEVTYDVDATDPEDDAITFSLLSGDGIIDENSGLLSFTPQTTGTFEFEVAAADSCGSVTTTITFRVAVEITLECPEYQSEFICGPETLCYPIGGIPEGSTITVEPPSAWFDYETGSVCFYTNCSVEKDLKVIVRSSGKEDYCPEGTVDSCMFTVSVTLNSNPLVMLPPDESRWLCNPEEICIPVGISDIDNNIVDISIEILPQGVYMEQYDEIAGTICFTPQYSGLHTIYVTALDACDSTDVDSIKIDVTINSAPTVTCPENTELLVCDLSEICLDGFICDDIDGNLATCDVTGGTFSGSTVCFTPVEGLNTITLTATDECGEMATCETQVTVTLNSPPEVTCPGDMELLVCDLSDICIEGFSYSDPDGNLSSWDVQGGTLEGNTVCFTPIEGVNTITLTATDECGETVSCVTNVTIIQNSPPIVTCPEDLEMFVCDLSDICIEGFSCDDLEGNLFSCEAQGGTLNEGTVCFTPVEGVNTITLTAVDECGEVSTCQTNITVTLNSAPTAVCPADMGLLVCDLGEISLQGFICNDIDGNLATCEAEGGILSGGEVTFVPAEGLNTITLTATDECGETATCQTNITVVLNSPPTASCPQDIEMTVCDLSEICIEGFLCEDIDGNLATCEVDNGILTDGSVCFTPVEGTNTITLTATDECGAITSCQTNIYVTLNSSPTATCPENGDIFVCDLSDICLEGFICDDVDGNLTACQVDNGTLTDGTVCFTPVEGLNTITLTATDDCGEMTSCATEVNVILNSPPTATCPSETEIFVCDLEQEICLEGFICDDPDGNLAACSVDNGTLTDGTVCFVPVAGLNTITLTATDACGLTATCTAEINVVLNSAPTAACPAETELFVCELSEVCVEGFICEDIDGNLTACEVDYGVLTDGTACFTPVEGLNTITLTATDECGLTATCTAYINVILNSPPTATTPEDTEILVCDLSDICLDGFICDDPDGNLTACEVDNGTLTDGTVCFAPVEGLNYITLTATDDCGQTATKTIEVNVVINSAPTTTCSGDMELFVCDLSEICVEGFICEDIDGNLAACEVDNGVLTDGTVCFMPVEGLNTITLTATDECGVTSTCNANITVTLNRPPVATVPDNIEMLVCDLSDICLDGFYCVDPDDNLLSCEVDNGILEGNTVCFTPIQGVNTISLTATDECGAMTESTVEVNIILNSAPLTTCPQDLELFVCDLSEICLEGFICEDPDGNLLSCDVLGGTFSDGIGQYTSTKNSGSVSLGSIYDAGDDGNIPGELMSNHTVCFTPVEGENIITLTATDECGLTSTCETRVTVTLNSPPEVTCPGNTEMFVCDLSEICLEGFDYFDADDNLTSFEVNGGTYTDGMVCFTPVEGLNTITVTAVDECGETATCQTAVTVTLNSAPEVSCPGDMEMFVCNLSDICLDGFVCSDIDGNLVSCVASGGILEGNTVCFTPVEGVNTITLTATDECGETVTCETDITVTLNSPPTVTCPDISYMYVCSLEDICLDGFSYSDVDDNITSTEITGGYFDGNTVCFTPVEGMNTITLTVTDECGEIASCQVNIEVELDPGFELTCPTSTTEFICEPTTLCYPLAGIPEGAEVTISPQSVWYDYETDNICFYTNCSVEKNIVVTVATECQTEVCDFTISVTMNSEPLVIMAPDTSVLICQPEQVCLPGGVSDKDDNIESITVSPFGTYEPIIGGICFTPEQSGEYEFILEAVDVCGAIDADTINVGVTLNSAPTVTCPDNQEMFVCDLSNICLEGFECDDVDGNLVSCEVTGGVLDGNTVCFTPVEGINTITLTATDDCGETATCVTEINVILNSAPTVTCPGDMELFVCDLSEICVDGFICDDADGNISTCEVAGGTLDGNTVCFTPVEGVNTLSLTVTDDCGETATCQTNITVVLNTPPTVTCPESAELFVCDLSDICLEGFACDDVDGNLVSCEAAGGLLEGNTVCFTPVEGINTITLTATDECGEVTACQTEVTVMLNNPPTVTCPESRDMFVCELSEICLEGFICDDVDGNLTSCEITGGTLTENTVCFTPIEGENIITLTAIDDCGETASCNTIINITLGTAPQLTCPDNQSVFLCVSEEICFPVTVTPDDVTVTITVSGSGTPAGSFVGGNACFQPETEGVYTVTVDAENDCGTASCQFDVEVTFNDTPVVDAGDDTEFFQCIFEEICLPVTITDADDNLAGVTVSHDGYYNSQTGEICFTPTGAGEYCLEITATDECEAVGSDIVCVTVETGDAADITDCPIEDIDEMLCEPDQICIPLTITPATAQVTTNIGSYSFETGEICFTVDEAGTYNVQVTAEEVCGSDYCEFNVNVTFGDVAKITCPDLPVSATLCEPDVVYVTLPITPATAEVTVEPFGIYDFETGQLSFTAEASGEYTFNVTASAPCGDDDCEFQVNVSIEEAPDLTCPDDFDTTVCIQTTSEICFDVDLAGTALNVTVSPEGSYANGKICVPIDGTGTYPVSITASNYCGTVSCDMEFTVYENLPPELTVPEAIYIPSCTDVLDEICIDGIFASDPENDALTIEKLSGPGTYMAVEEDSGMVCFTPESNDITYMFEIQVSDGCQDVVKTFTVTIYPSNVCETCIIAEIITDTCYIVGSTVPVRIRANALTEIGGYDLLIYYDASVMAFLSLEQGSAVPDWEYLTYTQEDNCGGSCPSGLLRIIAIADRTLPVTHPPEEQLTPDGDLAVINMILSHDQNIGGQYLPIGFYWFDCGDNTFSDPSGNELYMDAIIYDPFGSVIWDEGDDDLFPEENRTYAVGAPDTCLKGDKITPIRCVEFHNGGICIIHPDDIDDRGDLNLNGVAYEIADAVVYTNYFIYGYAAFQINVDGQTAASDINRDGVSLTVADLVYLIRIIIGDVSPNAKIGPSETAVWLTADNRDNDITIQADIDYPVGAGLLVFEYDGIAPFKPEISGIACGMDIAYCINESEIRVLLYSMTRGQMIGKGQGDLLNIGFMGEGDIRLKEACFAGYYGETLKTQFDSRLVPDNFGLSQNYPNPFNPSTSIDLSVPVACDWQIAIFNTTGQNVKRLAGHTEPGTITIHWDGTNDYGQPVASGIYFYKVQAADYTETRKMILLK